MISCKEASELLSKAMDEPLTPSESLALEFHFAACKFCAAMQAKLGLIRSGVRRLFDIQSETKGEQKKEQLPIMPESLKEKLKKIGTPRP